MSASTSTRRGAGSLLRQQPKSPNGDNSQDEAKRESQQKTSKRAGERSRSSESARAVVGRDSQASRRASAADGLGQREALGASQRASGAVALTAGEVTAYRAGYLAAIADDEAALWARRVRIAAKSRDIEVPRFWPQRGMA